VKAPPLPFGGNEDEIETNNEDKIEIDLEDEMATVFSKEWKQMQAQQRCELMLEKFEEQYEKMSVKLCGKNCCVWKQCEKEKLFDGHRKL